MFCQCSGLKIGVSVEEPHHPPTRLASNDKYKDNVFQGSGLNIGVSVEEHIPPTLSRFLSD